MTSLRELKEDLVEIKHDVKEIRHKVSEDRTQDVQRIAKLEKGQVVLSLVVFSVMLTLIGKILGVI